MQAPTAFLASPARPLSRQSNFRAAALGDSRTGKRCYVRGMLDLRFVSENLDEVRAQLARRGFDEPSTFERLQQLAAQRLQSIGLVEGLRHERNEASAAMGQIKDKKSEEFTAKRLAMGSLKTSIKEGEETLAKVETELRELLLHLPNLPHESVPDGKGEDENVVVRTHGEARELGFEPKDHVDLGTALGVLDFERASKISGARFVVLKGLAARMERALMQMMMDLHADHHGYEEVWVPVLLKESALFGTGQLPKFAADIFKIAKDDAWAEEHDATHDLYLCPTAEVPVTNLHANEIVAGESLPIAYAAYTPCFRSEAGSYGRDTRGMIRQHQFDKIEMVRFATPEDAMEQHALLTSHAEAVLQALGLHYRVVELCAGDLGFGAAKCFDIEVWLPAQNAYREISSCSWYGEFQARRMKARFRREPKAKPEHLHTINGSGLAIGRAMVAIFEQYQNEDGSITIPDALRPYMGGREQITR